MAVILAPDYKICEGPVVFLAGPIQGAKNWQKDAIGLITGLNPSINIASPRGDYSVKRFDYDTQVDWETHYLNKAADYGAILFWLAKEDEHKCDRSYAQTTRFELAEWLTKHGHDKRINLSIGVENGFTGQRYIRKRIGQDYPELPIFDTLDDVCEHVSNLF
jgi:hypothetical protein